MNLLFVLITALLASHAIAADEPTCPKSWEVPAVSRKDVYKDMPFQPGERAEYKVSYAGIHAGNGVLGVRPPTKVGGHYNRVFFGEAKTGTWYEGLFVVKDTILAKSQPWDFGAREFYIKQDEGRIFGSRYRQEKWIEFDQKNCLAKERTIDKADKEKRKEHYLERTANDALSAYFHLRTLDFKVGKKETIRVYTSEKNWSLEALPLREEKVTVPAGTFQTIKLKLQTYLGQELQQKGDIFLWLATDHKARPMVQVEAQVKVGSFWMELEKFQPGQAL